MQQFIRRSLAWVFSFSLLGNSLPVIAQEAPRMIVPGENLVVSGVPPIPAEIAAEVARYTESRSAGFVDWHPVRREMLISTRFGNTAQLHEVKFPGGARKQLTFFTEPVGGASWEPTTGAYFIFSRDLGGNEFAQLFRYDVADGRSTLLTDGGRSQNGSLHWNHSGRQFVYATTRRNGADRDLWLMDPLQPGDSRPVAEFSGGGWRPLDWSPDDRQILATEYLSINRSNLWLIDVASGAKQPLNDLEQQVSFGGAKFSPDGQHIYLTADADSEFQRLGRLNVQTRQIDWLTQDIAWDVEDFALSKDGQELAFVVNEAGFSQLYVLNTGSGERLQVPGLPAGVIGGIHWHANHEDLAITLSSARSTADVYSWNVRTRQIERWTESELGGLIAEELSEPVPIRWTSFDGLEITGFLYPASPRFTGQRPVIINIHGGPESQARPIFQARNNYYMNELGVAMIYPNVRGSTGYGKTFVTLDNGFRREDAVRDVGALLDWIATQPELDADRVMVMGGSYGGYMTLASAVHYSDRIRCALDVVGISHFGTFLKNTESYRRDLRRVEYGDERDPEMAAFFERIAPLNNAEKIRQPLFVVQGGNDPRVPLSEAEQIVARLQSTQTPVWYLMARDEGHGFRKKSNADFQFYATILFARQFLLGETR